MKRTISTILLVLLCLTPVLAYGAECEDSCSDPVQLARMSPAILGSSSGAAATCADSSCTGFLVCQNFETADTGWDNSESWTQACGTGNTCTAAYATAPLRGTQSYYIQMGATANMSDYLGIAASDGVYGFARIFFDTDTANSLIAVKNNVTNLLTIGWNPVNNKFVYDGSILGPTVRAHNNTYYVWWRYKKCTDDCAGTGNLIKTVWVNTSTDFDTATKEYDIITGTTETQVNRLYFTGTAGGGNIKYDQILLKTEAIGDVCE